ncbi:DUF771 domain-containing protein [Enterococcus sp. AZ177]|uniref:DUF771 domain-containing protein n=1 Tax=unclassified Enterococcus TaxID=2608891 RepID=UPI003D2FFC6D
MNNQQLPVQVNVQVDNQYMEKYAREYIEKLYTRLLKPQWLTMKDMIQITRHQRNWIMENIVDDPYVKKNKLAKKDGTSKNSNWLFDADGIRPFLEKLFNDLPDYQDVLE